MKFDAINPPPPASRVTLRRTGDGLEFTGASRNIDQEAEAAKAKEFISSLSPSTKTMLSGAPKGCFLIFFTIPVLFFLTVLGFFLFFHFSKPAADILPAVFVSGLVLFGLLTWVGIFWAIKRAGSRKTDAETDLASLPWQLKITPNEILATQDRLLGINEDHRICRPDDIRDIFVAPEGYLFARLTGGSSGQETQMPLTGSLEKADADWLRDSLLGLLDLSASEMSRAATPEPRPFSAAAKQMPDDFRILSQPTSGWLTIAHLPAPGLGPKITLTILLLVFGAAFGGPCLYVAFSNLDQIRELPISHWSGILAVFIAVVLLIFSGWSLIPHRSPGRKAELQGHLRDFRTRLFAVVPLVVLEFGALYLAWQNMDKLLETPFDTWLAAFAFAAGVGFVLYFGWQILWTLFGSIQFIATKHSMQIKKKIAFLGVSRRIDRRELKGFELTELVWVREGRGKKHWKLTANIEQPLRILPIEIDFDSADWLGRTLAEWFDVPFTRAHEKEAVVSRNYQSLK